MITRLLESFTEEMEKSENKNVVGTLLSSLLYSYRPLYYICILFFITIVILQIYQIHQFNKITTEKMFG